MTSLFARDGDAGQSLRAEMFDDTETFEALVRPIVAGARARGVADALELMGVAAILIDGTGRVLHIGARARRLLGNGLRIVENHVLVQDGAVNAALQRLVAHAIGTGLPECAPDSVLVPSENGLTLSVRGMSFPQADDGSVQLLRAILIVSEVWN